MELEVKQGTSVRFRITRGCFESQAPYDPKHADAVIVDCSDGRFTASNGDFIERMFGKPYADKLELPGGTATLHTLSSGTFFEVEVVRAKLVFLVRAHHSRLVILLAHETCGHYAAKYAGRSPEDIRNIQLSDLATVTRDLRPRFPGVEVRAFFKRPVNDRMVFDEIVPD